MKLKIEQKTNCFIFFFFYFFQRILCSEVFLEVDRLKKKDLESLSSYIFEGYEGETISYIIKAKNFDSYQFQYIAQDLGNCGEFSTKFMINDAKEVQNLNILEEICTQNMFQQNNFCLFQLSSDISVLKIELKCLSKSCWIQNNFFFEKEDVRTHSEESQFIVEKPIFVTNYTIPKVNKQQYIFINSQDIKEIFLDNDYKVNRYGSFSYIFEIPNLNNNLRYVQIILISKCNSLLLTFNSLNKFDQDSQNLQDYMFTYIFVIGECLITDQQLEYKLQPNIFYKWSTFYNLSQIKYVCQNESSLLFLFKIRQYQIDERYLTYIDQVDHIHQIVLHEKYSENQQEMCFYFKEENIQIFLRISGSDLNQEELKNKLSGGIDFIQLQKDERGDLCVKKYQLISQKTFTNIFVKGNSFQHAKIFKLEKYLFFQIGQGIFEYEYFYEMKYLDFNDNIIKFCYRIKSNRQNIQLKEQKNIKNGSKLIVKNSNQCHIFSGDYSNQNISQLDQPDKIFNLEIYYILSINYFLFNFKPIQLIANFQCSSFSAKTESRATYFNLNEEILNDEFLIYFPFKVSKTFFGKDQSGEFLIPLYSMHEKTNYFLVEKKVAQKYWKLSPLFVLTEYCIQFQIMKNKFDKKMQIYNYSFEQVLTLSTETIIQRNNTIYINMSNQEISLIQTYLDFKVQYYDKSFLRIDFKINQDYNYKDEKVVIQTCCNFIYKSPIIVYFKYIFEDSSFHIPDNIMQNLLMTHNEILFLFYWNDNSKQEYYRYSALYYARIQNEEELEQFYQLEKQDLLNIFKFSFKEVDRPILRESEICLILLMNKLSKNQQSKSYFLDDKVKIQVIEIDAQYEFIYLNNTLNRIIQMKFLDYYHQINKYYCKGDSIYYSKQNQLTIHVTERIESDLVQAKYKVQIIILDQQVKIGTIDNIQELASLEWIYFFIEKMTDYQILVQDQNDSFSFDYWFSNYEISSHRCTSYDQNLTEFNQKIEGILTQQNRIFRNSKYNYIYLRVSLGFEKKEIKFEIKHYTEIKVINENNYVLSSDLTYFQFDKKFQKRIFKIEYQHHFPIQLSKCSMLMKNTNQNLSNKILDQASNNANDIKQFYYFFVYPQLCNDEKQRQIQNQDQICLQTSFKYEYHNTTAVLEQGQLLIQKLELDQVKGFQFNSQNNYFILEVKRICEDCYMYIEYQSNQQNKVQFEIRFLLNETTFHSYLFEQSYEAQVFDIQIFQYLEIYNYQSDNSLDLTLIISKNEYKFTNIFQKNIKFQSLLEPVNLLLSKFEDQKILMQLSSNSNQFSEEQILKQDNDFLIFGIETNFTIKEIGKNVFLNKTYYFFELLDQNININIEKNIYSVQQGFNQNILERQINQPAYQQNIFQFKINTNQIQLMKFLENKTLQKQIIYFVYSKNWFSLMHDVNLGANIDNQKQNLVILNEKILDLRSINEEFYEITTSYYENTFKNLLNNWEYQSYFRIYIHSNNQSFMIPLSQIFKQQINSKDYEILEGLQIKYQILLMLLLAILILTLVFFVKFKCLNSQKL